MTYILVIHFIFATHVATTERSATDFATCKSEAVRIISELNPPTTINVGVECLATNKEMRV